MMQAAFKHIVILKFKEGTSLNDINGIVSRFLALKDAIPEIIGIEYGIHTGGSIKNKGFTHLFNLTFAGEKEKDVYQNHPDHVAFSEYLAPFKDDVFIFDYSAKSV